MSFEGRYQKLCPNGHYEEQDVYLETKKCEICGEAWEKSNLVDDTNEPGVGYDETMESEWIKNFRYKYMGKDIADLFYKKIKKSLK